MTGPVSVAVALVVITSTQLTAAAVAPNALTAFWAWARSNGADIGQVEVCQVEGRRGLCTTKDIREGGIVLKIPHQLLLSPRHAKRALEGCVESKNLPDIRGLLGVIIALLYQRDHQHIFGNASFWKAMVDILPRTFDSPRWWPEDDLKLLQGSPILQIVNNSKKEILTSYQRFAPACPDFAKTFTFEDWKWAYEMVGSRAFGLKSKTRGELGHQGQRQKILPAIVPLADLANHHDDANTSWQFDDSEDAYTLTARAPINRGAEVFISYGHKDAMGMLTHYGFVPEVDRMKSRFHSGFAPATLRLPMCWPPSLSDFHTQSSAARKAKEDVLKLVSPPPCCPDWMSASGQGKLSDEDCFAQVLASGGSVDSLFMTLGRYARGSQEISGNQLAKVLAHFRLLSVGDPAQVHCVSRWTPPSAEPARSFAEWKRNCTDFQCFPLTVTTSCVDQYCAHLLPISATNEIEALRLFRDLIRAHLRQTKWAEDSVSASAFADKASSARREMVRRYLAGERSTLQWNAELAEYSIPLLQIGDPDALHSKVCALASMDNRTSRALIRDFGEYVDTVIAPLAFLAFPQDGSTGSPCNVDHTEHRIVQPCLRKTLNEGVDSMIEKFRREHGYDVHDAQQEL